MSNTASDGDTNNVSAYDVLSPLLTIVSRDDTVADWVLKSPDREQFALALHFARKAVNQLQEQFDAEVLARIEVVKDELAALEKLAA